MANSRKRRQAKTKGKTAPTFQRKRRRTFSEKATIVLGILIALSMVLALVVNIGGNAF
jgi:cell division protein FtsL